MSGPSGSSDPIEAARMMGNLRLVLDQAYRAGVTDDDMLEVLLAFAVTLSVRHGWDTERVVERVRLLDLEVRSQLS